MSGERVGRKLLSHLPAPYKLNMAEREPSLLGGESSSGSPAKARPPQPAPAEPPSRADTIPNPDPAADATRHRSSTTVVDAPKYFVVGFWRRLAAASIDVAVILPVSLIMCWLASTVADIHLPASRHHGLDFWLDLFLASDPALVGALGLTLAIAAVYLLIFQITLGRTLGMRALKIRIIDIYGDAPTTLRAVVRTGGYLLGFATLGLGFVWVGFDSEKRGLHDWIASTYVVKA